MNRAKDFLRDHSKRAVKPRLPLRQLVLFVRHHVPPNKPRRLPLRVSCSSFHSNSVRRRSDSVKRRSERHASDTQASPPMFLATHHP